MKVMKMIAIVLMVVVLGLASAMVYEKYIVEPRVAAEAAKAEAEATAQAEAAKAEAEATAQAEATKAEAEATAQAEATKAEAEATAQAEAEVVSCKDELTGKKYYATKRGTSSLAWLRENETVENAVSSIECAEYGNSMVVDHDDPRIVMVKVTVDGEKVTRPFTVYDLYFGQEFEVEFCRNASYLYAYREGSEFTPSTKTNVKFKGFPDKDAFKSWICPKHQAVYQNRLVFEGYPDAEGYRGVFRTRDGLDPRVLRTIVLVETEEGRYDWCLTSCDCKVGSNGGSNGGSGGSSNGGSGSSGGSGSNGGSGSSKGETAHSPEGDDNGKHNPDDDEPATGDSDEKDSNESFKEEQWKDEGNSSGTGSSSGSSSEKDSNESFNEENWEAEKEENKTSNSQHSADDEEEKTSNSQQKAEKEENTSSNSKHTADEKEENTSSNSQQEIEKDSDEEFVLETF